MKEHIIICGLGKIGFSTYQILNAAKEKIVVISDIIHDEFRWQIEQSGGVFYLGDARNDQLLIQAGIKNAKAILALTDQDMTNTTIAMDARTLNPKINIIIRMNDKELGDYISKSFGIHQIFSPSELAAPMFARNITDTDILAQFQLKEDLFLVQQEHKKRVSFNFKQFKKNTLKNKKRFKAGKNKKEHFHSFRIDDSLFVIKKTEKPLQSHFLEKFLAKFNYFRSPAFEHLRLFLLILFCVIISAAVFLKWTMSLSYSEALYFVTTTVTTVGYGDINFLQSPPALKLFGCLLMLSGAAAIAILFSSITEIILTKRLPSVVGGLPVPKKDHVIVAGAGAIGHRVVTTLLEYQWPVAIIEDNTETRYSTDINHKVALVDGHLSSIDTLVRANIKTAKAIVIITSDDIENLSVSLAVQKLNPNIIKIIQVYNDKLGKSLQSILSLNKIFSIASIAAPYFSAAIFSENILASFIWKNQLIIISKESYDHPNLTKIEFKHENRELNALSIYSINLNFESLKSKLTRFEG